MVFDCTDGTVCMLLFIRMMMKTDDKECDKKHKSYPQRKGGPYYCGLRKNNLFCLHYSVMSWAKH